jgi:hypothetical protein
MKKRNTIIGHVVFALNNIDERFYEIPDVSFSNDRLIKADKNRKLERRFMSEFTIQYRKIIEDNDFVYESTNDDFEVPKKFMWYENPDLKIRETWEKLHDKSLGEVDMHAYFEKQPDFLVHKGQDDKKPKNQKLIIEAKTNPNTSKNEIEIFKDIFHIFIYSNKYNFQNSVLLLINIDFEKWKKKLNEYIELDYYSGKKTKYKKIYVVVKESFEDKTIVKSIDELLN